MPIHFPTTDEGWAHLLIGLAVVGCVVVGILAWRRLFPPAIEKLQRDQRYHQALAVYAANLRTEEPTREERRAALAAATAYLVNEHGVPEAEAAPNVRLLVAAYDREQSYELRHQALALEEAGDHESALAYFERAARLQKEHDRQDYRFLQRCVARVRGKMRTR
jgi:hypothetical protein